MGSKQNKKRLELIKRLIKILSNQSLYYSRNLFNLKYLLNDIIQRIEKTEVR